MMEDASVPRFAVVGHPNKGKSSIVATLAQDDSIYIDRLSGSTIEAQSYPMRLDGRVLYELIDTPGFQRARSVLNWLNRHCDDVSQRASTIKEFYQQHVNDSRFVNECELLRPIIEGAGIIYVVDGSRPWGQEYHAEMEILRWSGRSSLAIINPIDNDDHVQEWENALHQYFKTVRIFNAQKAEYSKRIELLSIFGQLDPKWQAPLQEAVNCLKALRQQQHRQAGEVITDFLIDVLQYQESRSIPAVDENSTRAQAVIKKTLEEKFKYTLRQKEQRCRRRIAEIYQFFQLQSRESELDLIGQDLFDQQTWYLFGLSKKQLIATAVGAGASAGVLIDIGTGGHSLLLGSIIGGVTGGLSAWKFSDQIAKFSIKGIPTGGQVLSYGPVSHPNFPFVVLGRALKHHHLICSRTHAARDVLKINDDDTGETSPLRKVDSGKRAELMSTFKNIQQFKKLYANRIALNEILLEMVENVD